MARKKSVTPPPEEREGMEPTADVIDTSVTSPKESPADTQIAETDSADGAPGEESMNLMETEYLASTSGVDASADVEAGDPTDTPADTSGSLTDSDVSFMGDQNTGEPIKAVGSEGRTSGLAGAFSKSPLLAVGGFMMLALLAGLAVLLFLRRRNVCVYVPGIRARDYKLVAKYRVEPETPEIDISDLDLTSSHTVAVEIKRSLLKKLIGKTFTVRYAGGVYTYEITQDNHDDWQEFELKEETLCGED